MPNGRKDERIPIPLLLNDVDDLEYFISLPQGQMVYDSLETALNKNLGFLG